MRLSNVLRPGDFDQAELSAMRLDAEVLRLGDTAVPIDVPVTAAVRARSIRSGAEPYGLVAELETAAWVHGALAAAPWPGRFCADVSSSVRTRMRSGVREVRFLPGEVEAIGGLRVTTPLRTVWDLARLAPTTTDDTTFAALLELAGLSAAEAYGGLASREPRLPNQREARPRLAADGLRAGRSGESAR